MNNSKNIEVTQDGIEQFLDFIHDNGIEKTQSLYDQQGLEWSDYLAAPGASFAKFYGEAIAQLGNPNKIWDSTSELSKIRNMAKYSPVANAVSSSLLGSAVAAVNLAYSLYVSEDIKTVDQFSKALTDSFVGIVGGTLIGELVLGAVGSLGLASIGVAAFLSGITILVASAACYTVYDVLKENGFMNPFYDLTEDALNSLYNWKPTPPVRRDPLVLDLNGDGVNLIDKVYFDHNGNGIVNNGQWISPADGILVLDRDKNGKIDSGIELFGDHTPSEERGTSSNGYAALSGYDKNNDGVINDNDQIYNELKVWIDKNSDGVSQNSELHSLNKLNISSISLSHTNLQGHYTDANGEQHITESVILTSNHFDRVFVNPISVSDSVEAMPNVRGTGTVRDLHEAMELDANLKSLIEKFQASNDRNTQLELIDSIFFSWAKTSTYYNASGPMPEKLFALDAYYGQRMPWSVSVGTSGTSVQIPTGLIDRGYDLITKMIYFELAGQTRLKGYFNEIGLSFKNGQFGLDLTGVLERFMQAPKTFELLADALDFSSAIKSVNNIEMAGLYQFIANSIHSLSKDGLNKLQPALIFNNVKITMVGENKTITFNDGNRLFTQGTSGKDTITFSYSSNNTVYGGTGDDLLKVDYNASSNLNMTNTFNGGTGNDRIQSGGSADTYLFERGDGQDTINDSGIGSRAAAGIDKLVFGAGITKDDVSVRRSGNNLVLLIGGKDSEDSITIENAYTNARFWIEELVFADGSKLVGNQLFEIAMVGTANADTLSGSGFNEIVYAGAADDVVSTEGGNDTVHGEEGNDKLFGGAGNIEQDIHP